MRGMSKSCEGGDSTLVHHGDHSVPLTCSALGLGFSQLEGTESTIGDMKWL